MLPFLLGLFVGLVFGSWALSSYKKSLQMTAETHQSEYINGQWYVIKPEVSE